MMVTLPVLQRDGSRPWFKTVNEISGGELLIERIGFEPSSLKHYVSEFLFGEKVVELHFEEKKYYCPLPIEKITEIINESIIKYTYRLQFKEAKSSK